MDTPNVPKIPKVPITKFFQEVISELKKVTWPTRDETIKLTVVVIAISVITALFIGGLDALFLQITTLVFRR